MNTDSPLKTESLEEYRAFMTKEKVAEALGIGTHNIPVLVRAGLLKPKGNPQKYCVKKFSRFSLARNMTDEAWLDKVAAAIHRHWRNKNARKRAKLAKANGSQNSAPAKEDQASESVAQ
jgi:hypothetical protein